MKYQEFISLFKKQVYALSPERQLDFALVICKRLFYDYWNFVQVHQWGDPDLLMDAINLCEKAKTTIPSKVEIKEMLSKVDSITPDMDDFGDEISSYGLNACGSIYNTLEFLLDKDPIHIYYVGNCLTDTIDFRVQENQDLTKEQIDQHIMVEEARKFLLNQTQ